MKKLFFLSLIALAFLLVSFNLNNNNVTASDNLGILWINPEVDQIQGSGWMPIANVVVKIGNNEFPIAAGEEGNFVLDLRGTGYNISAGSVVTATHAGSTTTPYTVTTLAFDSDIDYPDGTIAKGTAAANSTVRLYLSSFGQGGREWLEIAGGNSFVDVSVGGDGKWSYDFENVLSEAGFSGYDLHAFQPNKEAISTFVVRTQDPGSLILGVYPQINTIWGHSWPYGNLTLTVQKGTNTLTYNHGLHSGGDFRLHYDSHKINIDVGDTVTATIGELVLSHKVIDLKITSIDTEKNTVEGYGEINKVATVNIGEDVENQRFVTLDANGKWVADFSVTAQAPWGETLAVYDIKNTTEVWAHQNTGFPTDYSEFSEGRTIVTDQNNLIKLVRSFIITRMTEFAAMSSNIAAVLDDPNQKLIFESPNFGRIEFSSFDIETLLVINPEFLENLEDLINISFDAENNTLSSKVDTKSLEFLSGHGATIQFFNVAKNLGVTGLTAQNVRDYIDIKVYDGDELVTDLSDYFDWDNVTYNSETDVLTLPVNHFTEYVLGVSSELPETGSAIAGIVSLGLVSLTTYAILKKKKILS